MPQVIDVPHCRLVIFQARGQRKFEIVGNLAIVSSPDREKLAYILAKHLSLTHDEAYALLWSEVKMAGAKGEDSGTPDKHANPELPPGGS